MRGSFKDGPELVLTILLEGKKPLVYGMENIRPEEDAFVVPPGPKNPPSSPKRRKSMSHYSDIECSPSKKHLVSRPRPHTSMEERGLLFGDTTNSKVKATDKEDGVEEWEVDLAQGKASSTLRRKPSRGKAKMEVIIGARSKSRARKALPPAPAVEADVFA